MWFRMASTGHTCLYVGTQHTEWQQFAYVPRACPSTQLATPWTNVAECLEKPTILYPKSRAVGKAQVSYLAYLTVTSPASDLCGMRLSIMFTSRLVLTFNDIDLLSGASALSVKLFPLGSEQQPITKIAVL